MGWYNRQRIEWFPLGSLTTTGANETIKTKSPAGLSVALLQAYNLTERFAPNEIWYPVAIQYQVTTGITVTAAVLTLRKNGISAATGGTVTLPIQAIDATQFFQGIISSYTFAAPPAAGDQWSLLVTTTSTAGVVNPVQLGYAAKPVVGISEAVSI